ncbi:MAG: hypothetical protein U0T73_04670 [Chitinophagales bacterium]
MERYACFAILMVLMVIAFCGSTISISVIELTELESDYKLMSAQVAKDSTLKSPVTVFLNSLNQEIEEKSPELATNRERQEKIRSYLQFASQKTGVNIDNLPDKLSVLLCGCFLGLIGMIISILKETVYDKKEISVLEMLQKVALGFFSGVLVVFLSYVLPVVLFKSTDFKIRTETLIATSLLAGLFFESFINKIKTNEK